MPAGVDDCAWRALLRPLYEEAGARSRRRRRRRCAGRSTRRSAQRWRRCRPELVSFHFGLPDEALLERVRRTGAKIIGNATTVAEARALAARGVDAIIAQGWEAGGHAGRFLLDPPDEQMGLIALLPQIVDAVSVPVIAAGGIGDARGIAAAFLLGASAVQLGTAYLHCPESLIGEEHRAGLTGGAGRAHRLHQSLQRRPRPRPADRADRSPGPDPRGGAALPGSRALALAPLGLKPHWAGQAARLGRAEGAAALTERLGREALALLSGKG